MGQSWEKPRNFELGFCWASYVITKAALLSKTQTPGKYIFPSSTHPRIHVAEKSREKKKSIRPLLEKFKADSSPKGSIVIWNPPRNGRRGGAMISLNYAIAVLGKTQKFRAGFLLGFLCDREGGPIVQDPDPRKIYFSIFDSPPNSRRGKIVRKKKINTPPPLEKFKTDSSSKGPIVIWNPPRNGRRGGVMISLNTP